VHRNAPLTPQGRLRLCQRIESGWSVAEDRSSRPRSCPHQTPARMERRIVALRRSRKLGPARLAGIVGVPASTVHRVLVRYGMNRLAWMDRPTGRVIRRIETTRCGELVHIDVKKLARVPNGGGHKKLGRTVTKNRRGLGYTHIHTAIDAHSRLAYSEFAGTENTVNCVAFLDRAIAWFADQGITIERTLTDNGNGYRIDPMAATLRRARHCAHPHQALLAGHQRESGAVQPDPARRVGLRPALEVRSLTSSCS